MREKIMIAHGFLENHDWSGKTLIPFCTSGSSGINNSELHGLASGAAWLDGSRFSSGASRDAVVSWINGLGLDIEAK